MVSTACEVLNNEVDWVHAKQNVLVMRLALVVKVLVIRLNFVGDGLVLFTDTFRFLTVLLGRALMYSV